ncbi:hypothetical protein FEM48_Zijuj04G0154700 [Ziziphus jujuba var. spinosa]|uniref:Uncharacterized protein n=1 Tax=Ziziphus jujuba var. spinosa TaxID=714518 RepID=A0A978VKN6_ZIZJJ|nr:hypothetical protein FEM48_Zijuj04G0154700 [Ziziphus jujuba var. spinosa]
MVDMAETCYLCEDDECENCIETLKDGDALMNLLKLNYALPLPHYEKFMDEMMFLAIEMKFQTSSPFSLENTGYQNCFEALIEKQANFAKKEAEGEVLALSSLPYIIFLVSPIFLLALAMVESLYLPSFRGFYTQAYDLMQALKQKETKMLTAPGVAQDQYDRSLRRRPLARPASSLLLSSFSFVHHMLDSEWSSEEL